MLKKLCAVMIAVLMSLTMLSGIGNVALADNNVTSAKKHVNTSIDVLVGEKETATFVCEADSFDAKVFLYDENGNKLAVMRDNGTDGDEKAGDGIYSATVTLKSDTRKNVSYFAGSTNAVLKKYDVTFYNEFTQADYAVCDALSDRVNEYNVLDASTALSLAYTYLSANESVEQVSRGDGYVAFTTDAGLTTLYTRFDGQTKGASACVVDANGGVASVKSDELPIYAEEYSTWSNPNVLVARPYRNAPGEGGFENERYRSVAGMITDITGGVLTLLDDEATNPYNLLENFYKNGFVMFDSHGIEYENESYLMTFDGDGYTIADRAANRVLCTTGDFCCVTGDFFTVHYAETGRTMDNTFIYLGTCLGMKHPSIYEPMLALGARTVIGYSESVSFGYEGRMIITMFGRITQTNEDNESRSYNASEAVAYAKETVGAIDTNNGKAVMLMEGDGAFVTKAPHVNVTDVEFAQTEHIAYVNSDAFMDINISPAIAYGYTEVWTSSDSDVLEVSGPRFFKAKKSGNATVTCEITDNADSSVKRISCDVTVKYMHISTISVSLNTSMRFQVGQTRQIIVDIEPLNASDKNVVFTSNNPGSVTVNKDGLLTAIAPGKSTVTCVADNGEHIQSLLINVSTKEVYKRKDAIAADTDYVVVARTAGMSVIAELNNSDMLNTQAQEVTNGYVSGTVVNSQIWHTVAAKGGFYLYNARQKAYLSQGSKDGAVALTAEPVSIFTYSDNRIFTINPLHESTPYLRISDAMVMFSRQSVSTYFDMYELTDFSNSRLYSTVTFKDFAGATVATQTVERGGKAIAAEVVRIGYTFLGWDICLNGITADVTANALYREGTTDGNTVVVTFKDYDGRTIDTREVTRGQTITPPVSPRREGYEFDKWSESLDVAQNNMTVFAMYRLPYQTGDVNMDGSVNTGDAVAILQYSTGLTHFNDMSMALGDMNNDGEINTGDAIAVLKAALQN